MEAADKKVMAQRILGEYPERVPAAMLEFIDRFPDLQETPAQFQERCGQIALKRFWEEQEKKHAKHPKANGHQRSDHEVKEVLASVSS